MAIVLAGMTLLELVQLLAAGTEAFQNIGGIVNTLKAKGHKLEDPISVEHELAVQQALRSIQHGPWTQQDAIDAGVS
jgi:hypothetical protein